MVRRIVGPTAEVGNGHAHDCLRIIGSMSGSGGDLGYDYQADAIAYIAAHGLAGQPLTWFDGFNDMPAAWLAETSGPGDDIQVITVSGAPLEVQARHALQRGEECNEKLRKLVAGLKNSPTLRAVLLVDRHASQIIRDDLKHDIVRLGQGRKDGLKPITLDLLDHLKSSGLDDTAVFDRLRIVVVDLDEGSDGVATATALLSRVVASDKSHSAYKLLGKRGHDLIKRRGRDDIYSAARFLNEKVGLARTASAPAIVTTRFATWTHETNAYFYCPALQERFPIRYGWSQVIPMDGEATTQSTTSGIGVLETEIKRYQEWARLSQSSRVDRAVGAETFVDAHRLTAIVGGPGSGKTTLGRKLAFVAAEDRLAVRVRLATVAAIVARGGTFEKALVEAAVDSSGWNDKDGSGILASARLLIADGLDECDPRRADIAADLSRWAASHPQTSICVLTRPVGHSPAMLPRFRHGELLPLGSERIREIADWMIRSKITDASRSASAVTEFMDKVKEKSGNDVASIAARNPLLLSFLVRLFLDGQPIEGRRAVLFERVVELIRTSPPLERIHSGKTVDHATAWAAAEITGWSCIEKPGRRATDIYGLVSDRLGGGIDGGCRAESSIRQWEEHGLIELLTVGSLDAVVFVHLALGEYLAGRQLAQLDPSAFAKAIMEYRRKAKWREPILLSAGAGAAERVIQALLSLDSPADPESTEGTLAAGALAESEAGAVAESTINELAEHLKQRLTSQIPLVAVEGGLGLISVAQFVPDLVGSIALELWDHHQPWTRLAASCAGLASRSLLIQTDRVVKWIAEFNPRTEFSFGSRTSEWPSGTHDLQKAALPNALKRVAQELPCQDAEIAVVGFLTRKNISVSMMAAARSELKEVPYRSWAAKAYSQVTNMAMLAQMFEGMERFEDLSKAANRLLLEGILAACGGERDAATSLHSGDPLLGTLLSSMGFWQLTLSDVASIGTSGLATLQEVMRGMITVLGLDTEQLSKEVNSFLNRSGDLLEIPQIDAKPDWNKIHGANLNVQALAEALLHESWLIAWNAARLFEACSDQPSRQDLLRNALHNGHGRNLSLVGSLAHDVWGDD
jgi:hypothetical protein